MAWKRLYNITVQIDMKTCWHFHFEATDFRFNKKILYKVSSSIPKQFDSSLPNCAKIFHVEIVPDDSDKKNHTREIGEFKLTFDGTPEQTKNFACWVAHELTRRISFEQRGYMVIMGGLVGWEQLPENEEERELIGNTPFGLEMLLEEVAESPYFNPASINRYTSSKEYARLMEQFNEANQSRTLVDKFLGYFRIVEFLYYNYGGKKKLEQALLAAEPLRQHVMRFTKQNKSGEPITEDQCSEIIKELYMTRHRCAHLREKFGITSFDKEIETVVQPQLPIIEAAAHCGIKERYTSKTTDEHAD
ncbi:hypothetical protein VU06_02840 [Desulfobulbus sp. F3]|nr:hypothetical protein [Desulfobulbus sp. F3]